MLDKKPRFFYGYVIVAASFVIVLLSWGTYYSFGIFFAPVVDEFGWTRAMTSGAFSLSLIVSGIAAVVAGRLSDKFGPRPVLMVCGLLLGLGYALMSQISSIWQLYLLYGVIIGAGMGPPWGPLFATVARWFTKRRALMGSIAGMGWGLGQVVMPLLATWLIYDYSWRTSYIVIGGIILILIIAAALTLRRNPGQMGLAPYSGTESTDTQQNIEEGLSLKEAARTRPFWMFSAVMAIIFFGLSAILVHVVVYATGTGISPERAADIVVILGGVSVPSGLLMSYAGDRLGNRKMFTLSCVIFVVALVLLVFVRDLWMLYLFAGILGLAYGGLVMLQMPICAELFGLKSLGAIYGVICFAALVGESMGPVLLGFMFDRLGNYRLAFELLAAISAFTFLGSLFMKPPRQRVDSRDFGETSGND